MCKQDQCSPNKAKEDTTTFKVETTVTDLISIDSSRVIASHSRHYPTWKTICCFSLLHLCSMVDCYCSRLWIWRRCGLKSTLLGPISTRFSLRRPFPRQIDFPFLFHVLPSRKLLLWDCWYAQRVWILGKGYRRGGQFNCGITASGAGSGELWKAVRVGNEFSELKRS